MSDIILNTTSTASVLKYQMVELPWLTRKEGAPVYYARVLAGKSKQLNDVAAAMVARNGLLRTNQVRLVLDEMVNTIAELLAGGSSVNIGGFVTLRPVIRGRFDSEAADVSKAEVVVTAHSGAKIKTAAAAITKQAAKPVELPELTTVFNMASGEEGTLYSKGVFAVKGHKLSYDSTAEDEGFFLILSGNVTKCTSLIDNDGKGDTVVLRAEQEMNPGDEPELWLYTRMGGKALYQVKFEGELICTEVTE